MSADEIQAACLGPLVKPAFYGCELGEFLPLASVSAKYFGDKEMLHGPWSAHRIMGAVMVGLAAIMQPLRGGELDAFANGSVSTHRPVQPTED